MAEVLKITNRNYFRCIQRVKICGCDGDIICMAWSLFWLLFIIGISSNGFGCGRFIRKDTEEETLKYQSLWFCGMVHEISMVFLFRWIVPRILHDFTFCVNKWKNSISGMGFQLLTVSATLTFWHSISYIGHVILPLFYIIGVTIVKPISKMIWKDDNKRE